MHLDFKRLITTGTVNSYLAEFADVITRAHMYMHFEDEDEDEPFEPESLIDIFGATQGKQFSLPRHPVVVVLDFGCVYLWNIMPKSRGLNMKRRYLTVCATDYEYDIPCVCPNRIDFGSNFNDPSIESDTEKKEEFQYIVAWGHISNLCYKKDNVRDPSATVELENLCTIDPKSGKDVMSVAQAQEDDVSATHDQTQLIITAIETYAMARGLRDGMDFYA